MLNKHFLLFTFIFLIFNQKINAESIEIKPDQMDQPKIEIDLDADQAYLENLKRQELINSSSFQDEALFEEEEEWTQWKPLQNLSKKYYKESASNKILDKINGFTIILADANENSPKIKIYFKDGVYAFHNYIDNFRLLTIDYLEEKYGTDFCANWTFFKVENSEYLKWLLEQSGETPDNYRLMHYCIITDYEILEIAATHEPTVIFNPRYTEIIDQMGTFTKIILFTIYFRYFCGKLKIRFIDDRNLRKISIMWHLF